MKKSTFLLSMSLLLSSTTHFLHAQHHHDDLCETVAKATIITTVAASCGYGLYKLGQWLFKKSHEQILCEAHSAYQQTKDDYQHLLDVWHQEIYCSTDELFLCRLPIDNKIGIVKYLFSMKESLQNLENHRKNLNERINELENKHKEISMLNRMKKLKAKISQLHKVLKPLYSHLSIHKSYFILSEHVQTNSKKYQEEIDTITRYAHDEQTHNKIFATLIMSDGNIRYPYLSYVENLECSLSNLKHALKNLSHSYCLVEEEARILIKYLKYIHSHVVIHQSYHDELAERERNRLKEQQIALQKQQLALEREKVYELREHNRLKYAKLHDKKECTIIVTTVHQPEPSPKQKKEKTTVTNTPIIDHEHILKKSDQYQY